MSQSPMHVEIKRLTEEAVKSLRAKMATNSKVAGKGTFSVVATSDSVDRDGEILMADSWDFKNYMNNPVVLWCHDWESKPIGAVTAIEQKDGKVVMSGVFADTECGQEVRALYESGILRTVSVGSIIKERNGPVITKQEMIELSFVSIPANPDAMTTEQSKSLSHVNKMIKDAKKDTAQEQPQEVIIDPEPAQEGQPVELPVSTDDVEAQAKGLGMKAGRVLSAKNIATIQETLTQMESHKSGLQKTMDMLQSVLDSADSEKALQMERDRLDIEEGITAKIRLVARLTGEISRDRKKI